jgi:hypothetical protein
MKSSLPVQLLLLLSASLSTSSPIPITYDQCTRSLECLDKLRAVSAQWRRFHTPTRNNNDPMSEPHFPDHQIVPSITSQNHDDSQESDRHHSKVVSKLRTYLAEHPEITDPISAMPPRIPKAPHEDENYPRHHEQTEYDHHDESGAPDIKSVSIKTTHISTITSDDFRLLHDLNLGHVDDDSTVADRLFDTLRTVTTGRPCMRKWVKGWIATTGTTTKPSGWFKGWIATTGEASAADTETETTIRESGPALTLTYTYSRVGYAIRSRRDYTDALIVGIVLLFAVAVCVVEVGWLVLTQVFPSVDEGRIRLEDEEKRWPCEVSIRAPVEEVQNEKA